jgi:hypothetical protein
MKQRYFPTILTVASLVLIAFACRKRDAMLPDVLINFETTEQGIASTEDTLNLDLYLTRPAEKNDTVSVSLTETGVVYGSAYTTIPAATNNKLQLVVAKGKQDAVIKLVKVRGALFYGDEKLNFTIEDPGAPLFVGAKRNMRVSFAELVATTSATVINGGGANFPNKVFIDLSANRSTAVNRNNWDLGFYCGTDDNRVILNSSAAMMVKQLTKNDLTQVNATDTVGFGATVAFSLYNPLPEQLPFIDYPNGDLTRTAIAAISATAADNKVYIVNRGLAPGSPASARGWKKIRVLQNASGYTLQYADIASTSFQEIAVPKLSGYNFNYVSFDNGVLKIEPEKTKWDFAWTYFSNTTNFGAGEVPYLYQDIILLNRGVSAVKVLVATKPFADFSAADISGLTFSANQTAIGADWRSGGGPGSAPAVRTDRYYIVKDPGNNYYKVRFTALTQNGERGYPAYESVLVKKG